MALDPKLQKYTTASPVIASFPSEEVASGISQVTFLGIASSTSAGVDFHLVTDSGLWSQPAGSTYTGGAATTEYHFDTSTFNLPRTSQGIASVSFVIGGAGTADQHKVLVQLQHLDSSLSETNISDEITSQTVTQGAAVDEISTMIYLNIPITVEKLFAKGDSLRLTIKHEKLTGTGRIEIGHDPANQKIISIVPGTNPGTTVMRFIMQFRREG